MSLDVNSDLAGPIFMKCLKFIDAFKSYFRPSPAKIFEPNYRRLYSWLHCGLALVGSLVGSLVRSFD